MNLIQTELYNAKTKMLVMIPGTNLVALCPDNVAIVEAMIQNDSAYIGSNDKAAAPRKGYGGSVSYWVTQLKPILLEQKEVTIEEYKKCLEGVIAAVDRENSTHLNADGVGREEITQRILSLDKNDLLMCLKEPQKTEYRLVKYIYAGTHPTGKSKRGYTYRPRENMSFASKFCHYMCFYLFEGEDTQDNYSIYDNVLKKVLPRYTAYYGVKDWTCNDYADYQRTVDEVIRAANAAISRNGLDHLLWYYFKGRL